MGDRVDRFTDGAHAALRHAQAEALRFNHNYIGTEHLLLGLVREGAGVAAAVLTDLGVDLSTVRAAVESTIGRGERPSMGDMGLTPRAKTVMELAVDEARRLHHERVDTEHLLLGLVREGNGVGVGVLQRSGADLAVVRRRVLATIGAPGASPAGGTTS